MASVDDFLQFLVEELGKEGRDSLVVDAPTLLEKYWLVGPASQHGEALVHGENLTAVLNRISMAFDFTHKPLEYCEQDSLVKQVAEMAAEQDAALIIRAPSSTPYWKVEVEQGPNERGFTLVEALLKVLRKMEA